MKILSVDPGTQNFAYAVLSVQNSPAKPFKYKIKKMGMVKSTIKEPKENMGLQINAFNEEFLYQFDKLKLDGFICERFQSRGMKGNTIESVNMMVGMMAHYLTSREIDVKLVTASTWKNRVNKIIDIKDLYKLARVPNHITDAVCLGLYYGTFLSGSFGAFQDHSFRLLAEKINNESVPLS